MVRFFHMDKPALARPIPWRESTANRSGIKA